MINTILICKNCYTNISINSSFKFHLSELDKIIVCCKKPDIDFIFMDRKEFKKLRCEFND